MKRIISLVLAFVLVLSFSVTVFAVDDTWYGMVTDYLYRIDYKIGVGNDNLSNISSYTISIYSLLNAHLQSIDESLADSASYLEDIKTYTYNADYYLEQLYTVLADREDLALKESQKDNQQFIQDNFFTPGSDLSIDTNKLGALVSYSDSFNTFFNFSSYGNSSPLDQLGEGSPFSQWFTEENGKSMDPTFSAGGGGSDPDVPNPDDPDPEPETTATPTLSYNESTFTVSASGNGTVIMYVDGVQVSNPYTFSQGDSAVTYVVTATAQEEGKLISNTARLDVTIEGKVVEPEPEPEPAVTTMPSISYNEPTFTVSASGNGTVIMYVDGVQVSNPYSFTQGDSAVTYVVTATAQEEGKLISNTARLEVTVPKYEPPFSVTNLIPTSKASYNSSSIFNSVGYRSGYYWTTSSSPSSSSVSGMSCTGWINCTKGDTLYIYGASPYSSKSFPVLSLYSSAGLTTVNYGSGLDWQADSNGVYSYVLNDSPGGQPVIKFACNLLNINAGTVVTLNEYPIQVSASAYSLRGRGSYNPGNNIVTSFYNSRQSVFDFLLRGGRSR